MALPVAAAINVRPSGSDLHCGGGFNAARGGVDYTLQDAAQASGTVTSSGTTVTATTGIFTSGMVGNYITDGTTYAEITAFTSATVVTVDAAPSWTAATIYVGGALASPGKARAVRVPGNRINVKAGTYNLTTASSNVAGGVVDEGGGADQVNVSRWEGYQNTPGDKGTPPILRASGISSATLFSISGAFVVMDNFTLDGAGLSNLNGLMITGGNVRAVRIRVLGFDTDGISMNAPNSEITFCAAYGCTQYRGILASAGKLSDCAVWGCTGTAGIEVDSTVSVARCVSFNNTGSSHGFQFGDRIDADNLSSYNNAGDGIHFQGNSLYLATVVNCVAYGNGGYGLNQTAATGLMLTTNTATGSNTAGALSSNVPTPDNPIVLTANPFDTVAIAALTNSSPLQSIFAAFAPNTAAGGGALLRGAGYIPYLDVGAVQHQDAGGGGSGGLFTNNLNGGLL